MVTYFFSSTKPLNRLESIKSLNTKLSAPVLYQLNLKNVFDIKAYNIIPNINDTITDTTTVIIFERMYVFFPLRVTLYK